jgi:Protein of unknown function (DUF3489)
MRTTNSQTKPSGASFSDTALVLLSNAANRDDRQLLPAPDSIKTRGAALHRALAKLLKQKLIEETAVNAAEQAWRSEEETGRIGLRITDAGLTAIGVPALAGATEAEVGRPAKDRAVVQSSKTGARPSRRLGGASASGKPAAVKPDSKQALLVTQLSRSAGATIAHLVGTLGWQPHTVRAALTGLRRRGYDVAREKNRKGETVYRANLPATDWD